MMSSTRGRRSPASAALVVHRHCEIMPAAPSVGLRPLQAVGHAESSRNRGTSAVPRRDGGRAVGLRPALKGRPAGQQLESTRSSRCPSPLARATDSAAAWPGREPRYHASQLAHVPPSKPPPPPPPQSLLRSIELKDGGASSEPACLTCQAGAPSGRATLKAAEQRTERARGEGEDEAV